MNNIITVIAGNIHLNRLNYLINLLVELERLR